jgi:hypothetical protein
MSSLDPLQIEWRTPWGSLAVDRALKAEIELQREMSVGHVLFGRTVKAIGTRQDCDDVLFYLGERAPRFAVVHLTYNRETRPEWPSTELFESLTDWVQNRMIPDAEDWDA